MTIKKIVIFMFIFFSNFLYAKQNFLLKKIRFEGLDRVSIHEVLKNLPISVGKVISDSDINHTIHYLFNTGKFNDIKTLCETNTLVITVKERPIITQIQILGNNFIQTEIIKKYLETFDLRIGNTLNNMVFSIIEKKIKEHYYTEGYFNIKVKLIPDYRMHNSVHITILLNEGNFAEIKKINIVGNHTFSSQILEKILQNENKIFFWQSRKYNHEVFFDNLKKLNEFYLNKGYLKFNIDNTQINFTPDSKEVYLYIKLYEGNRYKISKIVIDPIQAYQIEIKNLLNITIGEFYNYEKLTKIENIIKNIFYKKGYIDASININTKVNDDNHSVELYINIDIGKRYHVRRINFQGNYISQHSVLRREIPQMESTWLDNSLIEEGKMNLERTGYFESVDFNIVRLEDIKNQVDIFYTIKERQTGNFNFGLGYSKESNITFNIAAQEENWLGTGHSISINVMKNNSENYTELSFINPYFTINGCSFGGKIFYNQLKANHEKLIHYSNTRYGIESTFSVPISKNNMLSYGLGYEHNVLFNMEPQITILRYLKAMHKSKINKNSYDSNDFILNYGWIFDTLDRQVLPTVGTNINFIGKTTIPSSMNSFHKTIIDAKTYIPLNKNNSIILLGHSKLGYGMGFGQKEFIFYENFYVGGINSVRGFLTNTIGPKTIYLKNKKNCAEKFCVSQDTIGGNALAVSGIELIFPIPLLNKQFSNTLRASLFLDFGTTWDSKWSFSDEKFTNKKSYNNIEHIRASTGIAVQWISPFGPINFSYGIPIKKYRDDQLEYFQFNFGKTW